jgi:hemerythrin
VRAGRGAAEVEATLGFLSGYVRTHFAEEERLLAGTGWPGLEAHRASHAAFAAELDGLRAGLAGDAAGREAAAEALHHRLRSWLVHHICTDDRSYAAWLAARAPEAAHA